MNDETTTIIQEYIYENLFIPGRFWPDYWFKGRSYSRWVSYELIFRISNSSESPISIIEELVEELDRYKDLSETTDSKESRFIFTTAKEEVLEILLYLKERKNNGPVKNY